MGLDWAVLQTGLADLYRAPLLLQGERDAILVDGGFTFATGRLQVEAIRASGRTLRAVVVTCSDPDYYFGLAPVKAAYPDVEVIAPPEIAARIAETAAHKVEVWREQLGENGPASPSDVVLPRAYEARELLLEGETIEIVSTRQAGHYHLWLPQRQAILGGVQISSGNHVWMADTPLASQREDWFASLEDMIARNPAHALPGHLPPGAVGGIAAIRFTQAYIRAFEQALDIAPDGEAVIAIMKQQYPDLAMEFILDLGARVCKGEQLWP